MNHKMAQLNEMESGIEIMDFKIGIFLQSLVGKVRTIIRHAVGKLFHSRLALAISLGLLANVALTYRMSGQIFVLSVPSSTNCVVGEYSVTGKAVNASLIQFPTIANFGNGGLTYDGNGIFFAGSGSGVGKYITSGTAINTSLVASLNDVIGVVVDNGDLFVMWETPLYVPMIGEYTTSGTPINASLISLAGQNCVNLKGDGNGHLFLLTGNTIAEYSTSGATLYPNLISFSSYCSAFAVDGNGYIYVANGNGDTTTISKYTVSGALVNASLISGLPSIFVTDITLDGSGNLFLLVTDLSASSGNYVSDYTTSGKLINSSLISGLQNNSDSIISIPVVQQTGTEPTVNLIKAVVPTFSNLLIGTNYQLQVSSDLNTWRNQGVVFSATNSTMPYPQYFKVSNWNELFFRLVSSP
jgi:hypothetical protein